MEQLVDAGIYVQLPMVAALAQILEDLEAELTSISAEVSQLELNFCNTSNGFLQTHRQFWPSQPFPKQNLPGSHCGMCLLPERETEARWCYAAWTGLHWGQ